MTKCSKAERKLADFLVRVEELKSSLNKALKQSAFVHRTITRERFALLEGDIAVAVTAWRDFRLGAQAFVAPEQAVIPANLLFT